MKDCTTNEMFLYYKGSPEILHEKSKDIIDGFDELLNSFTMDGMRVLGLAMKKLD